MNNYILELKARFVEEQGRSALQYLETGFDLFHRHLHSESFSHQAALGNLAVALELMLKTFIAEKNLGAVFKDIPPSVRVLLSCPERIPAFFTWGRYDLHLRSSTFQTLNLEECISCFYLFFPHLRQLLQPHLEFLSDWRSTSLHTVLPSFSGYDFERSGYAVLQTVMALVEDTTYSYFNYTVTERDKQFLNAFAAKRVERVSIALGKAHSAFQDGEPGRKEIIPAGWNIYMASCPVCSEKALIEGYTELSRGEDEEGPYPVLDFFAVSGSCVTCGLVLNDMEELKLAGMRSLYDRSEDLDSWFKEHGYASTGEQEM